MNQQELIESRKAMRSIEPSIILSDTFGGFGFVLHAKKKCNGLTVSRHFESMVTPEVARQVCGEMTMELLAMVRARKASAAYDKMNAL